MSAKVSKQQENTTVVRISLENHAKLGQLKKLLAKKLGLKKVTYDEVLEQGLACAELLAKGKEQYTWGGKVYEEPSTPWSLAVEHAVKQQQAIEVPMVVLQVGKDDSFEVPVKVATR